MSRRLYYCEWNPSDYRKSIPIIRMNISKHDKFYFSLILTLKSQRDRNHQWQVFWVVEPSFILTMTENFWFTCPNLFCKDIIHNAYTTASVAIIVLPIGVFFYITVCFFIMVIWLQERFNTYLLLDIFFYHVIYPFKIY